MTSELVVFVAQTIVMPATFISSLLVTVLVAFGSHRTSKRLTALEMLRGVDQQWQTLNAAILAQPQIQRHINPEGSSESERTIVRRNIAFYVLNVALQLNRAKAANVIDAATARQLQDEQAAFLSLLHSEVEDIVSHSSVYRSELGEFLARFPTMPR